MRVGDQASRSVLSEEPDGVAIRAFRGTRRSSVYRECLVSEKVFGRLLATGETRGLPLLSSLDSRGPHELDKKRSRRFAEEAAVVEDAVNEPDFAAIVEIALWCAHAKGNSWLRIVGPRGGQDATLAG
jgi:hypothetical protein